MLEILAHFVSLLLFAEWELTTEELCTLHGWKEGTKVLPPLSLSLLFLFFLDLLSHSLIEWKCNEDLPFLDRL